METPTAMATMFAITRVLKLSTLNATPTKYTTQGISALTI
jgi:hypothetical protein